MNHIYRQTSTFSQTPILERYQKYGGNMLEPVCQSCGDIFVLERYDNKLCATCGAEMVEDQAQQWGECSCVTDDRLTQMGEDYENDKIQSVG